MRIGLYFDDKGFTNLDLRTQAKGIYNKPIWSRIV